MTQSKPLPLNGAGVRFFSSCSRRFRRALLCFCSRRCRRRPSCISWCSTCFVAGVQQVVGLLFSRPAHRSWYLCPVLPQCASLKGTPLPLPPPQGAAGHSFAVCRCACPCGAASLPRHGWVRPWVRELGAGKSGWFVVEVWLRCGCNLARARQCRAQAQRFAPRTRTHRSKHRTTRCVFVPMHGTRLTHSTGTATGTLNSH